MRGTKRLRLVGGAALLSCAVLAAPAATTTHPGLTFHTEKVNDPMSNGIEAFRMLIPNGWVRSGGVVWNLRYSNVASVSMQVRNPKTRQALQVFPLIPQIWEEGTYLGPDGTNYLGMEVRRPLTASALVQQLIVPAFRGNLRAQVVSSVALPKVVQVLNRNGTGGGLSNSYDATRVRIAYSDGGRAMEEDFYSIVSYTQTPAMPGTVMWQPQILYSFRAPRGQLDSSANVLQTMISSVRASLKWYAGYQYVFNLWIQGQMQAINAAGALSKQISSASDSISRSTSEAWENQQASYDRIYGEMSNQIRGVETYNDPFAGHAVELPNTYSYAWVSSNGQYSLSDDAGFNPNVGSTVDWRLLKVAR